jgi:hypothetical protein
LWSGARDSEGQLLWMKRNKRTQTDTNGKCKIMQFHRHRAGEGTAGS